MRLTESAQNTVLRLQMRLTESAQNTVLRLQMRLTESVTYTYCKATLTWFEEIFEEYQSRVNPVAPVRAILRIPYGRMTRNRASLFSAFPVI